MFRTFSLLPRQLGLARYVRPSCLSNPAMTECNPSKSTSQNVTQMKRPPVCGISIAKRLRSQRLQSCKPKNSLPGDDERLVVTTLSPCSRPIDQIGADIRTTALNVSARLKKEMAIIVGTSHAVSASKNKPKRIKHIAASSLLGGSAYSPKDQCLRPISPRLLEAHSLKSVPFLLSAIEPTGGWHSPVPTCVHGKLI